MLVVGGVKVVASSVGFVGHHWWALSALWVWVVGGLRWASSVGFVGRRWWASLGVVGEHRWVSLVDVVGCCWWASLDVVGGRCWTSLVGVVGCRWWTLLGVVGGRRWVLSVGVIGGLSRWASGWSSLLLRIGGRRASGSSALLVGVVRHCCVLLSLGIGVASCAALLVCVLCGLLLPAFLFIRNINFFVGIVFLWGPQCSPFRYWHHPMGWTDGPLDGWTDVWRRVPFSTFRLLAQYQVPLPDTNQPTCKF